MKNNSTSRSLVKNIVLMASMTAVASVMTFGIAACSDGNDSSDYHDKARDAADHMTDQAQKLHDKAKDMAK